MNQTLQQMVSKPTHLPFTIAVIFTNVTHLAFVHFLFNVAFQSSLILLCFPGFPKQPATKRIRLAEPPHTPIMSQAVPPETHGMSVYLVFNNPVHVLQQLPPHGFISINSRLK